MVWCGGIGGGRGEGGVTEREREREREICGSKWVFSTKFIAQCQAKWKDNEVQSFQTIAAGSLVLLYRLRRTPHQEIAQYGS